MDRFFISRQGDMLDWIAWRYYGTSSGTVEAILADPRNFGLASLPLVLPLGTKVVLPQLTITKNTDQVKLWN